MGNDTRVRQSNYGAISNVTDTKQEGSLVWVAVVMPLTPGLSLMYTMRTRKPILQGYQGHRSTALLSQLIPPEMATA